MRFALPGGGFSGVDGFASFFFLHLFGGCGSCGFFGASAPVVRRTASVVLGDKDGDNGDKVVSEFALWVGLVVFDFATLLLAENHEFCISLSEDPLDEFHSESSEPIFVGHHDLSDASLVHAFQ